MGYVYRDVHTRVPAWAIAYRDVDGRLRRERTKAANRTLARRILAEREDAVERAKLQDLKSVAELIAPKPSVTIRQFAEEYMEHIEAHCTKSTATRYKNLLETHIRPKLGHLTLRETNPGHVQRYGDLRLKEAKPATVRQEMMFLSGMFREAMKRDLIETNPLGRVDKPSIDNTIVRYLDHDEEKRLLGFASEPLRSAIIASIHSGLRDGELSNLTWADVRLQQRVIVVRHTKSKRDRVVPMSRTLHALLEKLPRHISSPYVFTSPRTGGKYDRFDSTGWREAIKRSGIQNFRWHDLRHTFGSRLAQAGVPILTIKELMGHSQITVTMRYAHLAPSNLRTAVEVLDLPAPEPTASTNRSAGPRKRAQEEVVTG